MEPSSLKLISEIGSQHHLVVNEEGIVQFTDDGDELLIYDDLTASIVRVPSCPVAWNHFGLEIQTNNKTSLLTPITNPNFEVKEEIEIKTELVDYEMEMTPTTIQTAKETNKNMFTKRNKIENKALMDVWEDLQNDSILQKPKMKPEKKVNQYRPKKTQKGNNSETSRAGVGDLFKEHFTVKKFTPEEQILEFEKRKENRQKYLERLYKCQTCYRGFQLQENYAKHMLCHMVKTKYYCDICRLYLETKSIYHSHMNQHKQKFMCNHCSFESYHRASSSLHARAHSIDLPQSYQTYMNHARTGKKARYVCGRCGFSFVNEVGLKLHTRRTHRDYVGCEIPDNGPMCSMCDVMFASDQAFTMHCRIMHSEYITSKSDMEELYVIPPSPSVETAVSLQPEEFMVPNSSDTLHNDDSESSRFSNRTGGDDNSLVPSFLCYLCGDTFLTDSHLEIHMNDHKEEDDDKKESNTDRNMKIQVIMQDDGDEEEDEEAQELLCEVCQRTFTDPVLLYRHVHSHKYALRLKQQSRRPECPQCGMTFSTFSNRLRHIKYAHTEVRPSICDICNKGFKSEPELRSHVDHVHLKKPWPKRNRGRGGREHSPF